MSTTTTDYFHVRISPSRKQVVDDYLTLIKTVKETGQGLWDQYSKKQIKEGDYLGFITGPSNNEQISIYKIARVCTTSERLSQWASTTPYTAGNGRNIVSHRSAIVLTKNHFLPKTYDWRNFRRETGLGNDCSSWMPRGIQKVLNIKTTPFVFPEPDNSDDEVILLKPMTVSCKLYEENRPKKQPVKPIPTRVAGVRTAIDRVACLDLLPDGLLLRAIGKGVTVEAVYREATRDFMSKDGATVYPKLQEANKVFCGLKGVKLGNAWCDFKAVGKDGKVKSIEHIWKDNWFNTANMANWVY